MTTQESPTIADQLTRDSLDLMRDNQQWIRNIDQPIAIRMRALDLAAGLEIAIINREFDLTEERRSRLMETIRVRAAAYEDWIANGFGSTGQ